MVYKAKINPPKKCVFCDNMFVPAKTDALYCGKDCYNNYEKTISHGSEKNCLECGKLFLSSKHYKSYCSDDCKDKAYTKEHIIYNRNCNFCDKAFSTDNFSKYFCEKTCTTNYAREMVKFEDKQSKEAKLHVKYLGTVYKISNFDELKEYAQYYQSINRQLHPILVKKAKEILNFPIDAHVLPKQVLYHVNNDIKNFYIKCKKTNCDGAVEFDPRSGKYNQFHTQKCKGDYKFDTNSNPKKRHNRTKRVKNKNMSKQQIKEYVYNNYTKHGKKVRLQNDIKIQIENLVNFIETKDVYEKLWYILNDKNEPKLCKECNKHKCKWNDDTKKYYKFCSKKCQYENKETNIKRRETNIKKFGVPFAIQLPEIEQKRQNTCLDRYGKNYYTQTEEFDKQKKENNLLKYGVDEVGKLESHQNKIKETTKNKYGVEYYWQSEDFKNKMIQKYGATSFMKCDFGIKTYIDSMNRIYGYPSYIGKDLTETQKLLLDDSEYLKLQHHDNKKTMEQIAKDLNVSHGTIKSKLEKYSIEQRYNANQSIQETEVKEFIKSLGFDILENDRKLISKELDIYIPSKKIAIEYCGLYWHAEINKDKNAHLDKLVKCNEIGIRLITIFEDEWTHKKELIKEKIMNILGVSEKVTVYARKCNIEFISSDIKKIFFDANHIQEDGPSSINLGLIYNNELVACMGFIQMRDDIFNLNRYATNYNVPGGFSRLLNHFEKEVKPKKIISFADLRWSVGDLYKNNNFVLEAILKPSYSYILGNRRFHKFNFRKSKLKSFSKYDSTLTEEENMKLLHIHKIWDCGLFRYAKTY